MVEAQWQMLKETERHEEETEDDPAYRRQEKLRARLEKARQEERDRGRQGPEAEKENAKKRSRNMGIVADWAAEVAE